MVYTSNQSLTQTNTPQTITGSRVAAAWFIVVALDNNTNPIYVGGVNPANKSASLVNAGNRVGIKLLAGSSMLFPQVPGATVYDLSTISISGSSGDAYSTTYVVR